MIFRRCSHCKESKPLDSFGKNRSRKDGHSHNCLECARKCSRESDARHRTAIRKASRVYFRKNRERILARQRQEYREWVEAGVPPKKCPICETVFTRPDKYCSRKCMNKGKSLGQEAGQNPNWKGGKYLGEKGYVFIRRPGGYIPEHRVVMQNFLGRTLHPWEIVHHRNGKRDDNRLKNLTVVTSSTHRGEITCPKCEFAFHLH